MPSNHTIVYLVPAILSEDGTKCIPPYIIEAVKDCQAFFVEDERTARRYLKKIWKEMPIDSYKWYRMDKNDPHSATVLTSFRQAIANKLNIGIISEAGCPGIADPGQVLVSEAHRSGAIVKPLVGPSSILLALMASGMNGQQFRFVGYLPIGTRERFDAIKELEKDSRKNNCTEVFIETPYRNNQLLQALLQACDPQTLLCIAADLTSANEFVQTRPVAEWKQALPNLHKKPAIFCLIAH